MSPNASHRVRPGLSSAASLITTLLISFDQEVLNQHLNLVTPEYPFFESPCRQPRRCRGRRAAPSDHEPPYCKRDRNRTDGECDGGVGHAGGEQVAQSDAQRRAGEQDGEVTAIPRAPIGPNRDHV